VGKAVLKVGEPLHYGDELVRGVLDLEVRDWRRDKLCVWSPAKRS
jgi:hypothetical protein